MGVTISAALRSAGKPRGVGSVRAWGAPGGGPKRPEKKKRRGNFFSGGRLPVGGKKGGGAEPGKGVPQVEAAEGFPGDGGKGNQRKTPNPGQRAGAKQAGGEFFKRGGGKGGEKGTPPGKSRPVLGGNRGKNRGMGGRGKTGEGTRGGFSPSFGGGIGAIIGGLEQGPLGGGEKRFGPTRVARAPLFPLFWGAPSPGGKKRGGEWGPQKKKRGEKNFFGFFLKIFF